MNHRILSINNLPIQPNDLEAFVLLIEQSEPMVDYFSKRDQKDDPLNIDTDQLFK
jgi:hypothetical protein